MGDELPQYAQIAGSKSLLTDRVKKSICKVYVDLLQFIFGVVRIFTHEDGSKFVFLSCLKTPMLTCIRAETKAVYIRKSRLETIR